MKLENFLKTQKKFIEIDVKNEKDNSRIIKFLNLRNNVLMSMPHKNKTKK